MPATGNRTIREILEICKETISIHHYAASWSSWQRRSYFKMIKMAAKILGKERYLKIKRKIKKQG